MLRKPSTVIKTLNIRGLKQSSFCLNPIMKILVHIQLTINSIFSDNTLLTLDEYLQRIRSELIRLMNEGCKVKLTVDAVYRLKKDPNDKRTLHIKSKNTTDIDEIFSQLIKKHEELSKSLKNIDLASEGIESITYNFTEIIKMNTFVESPEWLKNKKCTINPQNNDNKCFQYAVTPALYHQQIMGSKFFRVSKIKPYVNNLNWNNVNFPPQEQDYKTLEMNNKSIALSILQHNAEKISHVYMSRFNFTREHKVILLIITDGQKPHYIFVKYLDFLLKSKYHCSEKYCLNCLKLFRTKSGLEKHFQLECHQLLS